MDQIKYEKAELYTGLTLRKGDSIRLKGTEDNIPLIDALQDRTKATSGFTISYWRKNAEPVVFEVEVLLPNRDFVQILEELGEQPIC